MIHEKDNGEQGFIEIVSGDKVLLSKKNRIVSTSRTIKASMAIGGSSADFIRFVRLGRTGAILPPTVLESDTSLFNPIIDIPVSFLSEPRPFITDDPAVPANGTVVTWTAVIPIEETLQFDEAGLFSDQSYMFSRVTFPSVTKPSGVAMALRWRIQF